MKPKEFFNQLDDCRIADAIQSAELRTSGEIRVYVTRNGLGKMDVFEAAAKCFKKLRMSATAERNGVLLYFAPRDQRFTILGDCGIDEKCGENLWDEIADELHKMLKNGQFTDAVVAAIHRAGEALATHFPRSPDDRNELPDAVQRD